LPNTVFNQWHADGCLLVGEVIWKLQFFSLFNFKDVNDNTKIILNPNKNIYRVFVKLTGEVQTVIINNVSTGWSVEKGFS
jgi:hypothetical protein